MVQNYRARTKTCQNNDIITDKTKAKDILEKIRDAKWRWVGHVARFKDNL